MPLGVPDRRRAVVGTAVIVAFLWVGVAVAGASTAPGSPAVSDATAASDDTTVRSNGTDSTAVSPSTVSERIQVTYRIDRTPKDPETIRVNYTAEIPDGVVELRIGLDGLEAPHTVESTDGIVYNSSAGWWKATSPGGEETTAELAYTVESNVTLSFASQPDAIETADWAFVSPIQTSVTHEWTHIAGQPAGFEDTHTVAGEGYAADGFAFLGAADAYDRTANRQSFRLVVPEVAEPSADPDGILNALGNASELFDVGDRDPAVTAFVAPDAIRRGGLARGAAFWASQDSSLTVESSWYHEYVHTRQAWTDSDFSIRAGNDVEWLTEGSADYYGGYLAWRHGTDDADSFRDYVATDRYANAVLQDRNDDSRERKNYEKGRRVLAALDIRLHQHTGGEETLLDVIRRLNALQGDELRYRDLRSEVVEATNESTGAWLDRHVTTTAAPDIPADIESAYGLDPVTDPALEVALSPSSVAANESTTVTVTASDGTGGAIEDATVEVPGLGLSATTDATGEATLTVDATTGEYGVSVTAEGYTGTTEALVVRSQNTPTDPTGRALAITGRNSVTNLTQNDVTIVITRFERGLRANGVDITQNDVTTIITLFERN